MSREANIPLALWISAALLFHFMGGGGGAEVAQTVLDKKDLQNLIARERAELRPPDTVFEILGVETLPAPGENVAAPDKESEPTDDEVEPDPDAPVDPVKLAEQQKKKEEKLDKPDEPKPEPEKKAVVVPPPLLPVQAQPAAPKPPPPPPDKRISVRQNAEKNQPDNPNAPRLADDANHVAEETMAKIRSHDQDSAKPNPGAQKALGPKDETGNSDQDKEADSEERKGRDDKAPGEAAPISTSAEHSNPGHVAQAPSPVHAMPSVPGMNGTGARSQRIAEPASPPPSPGGAGPASAEAQLGGGNSTWTMDPANPGGNGSSRTAGRRRPGGKLTSPIHVGSLGLGGTGVPGGPNINLTMPGLEVAIGSEKLRQEREADGASRRGEHAGRIAKGTDFQKYRAAIENYEPSVKLADRTALNAARSPFATYLTTIHNKIHPFFADRELDAMDQTRDKAFTDQQMYATVEIILAPDTGRIVRRGIVKNSGSTAFDMIALKSIDSASPFGKAPDAVVSPDGRVYLHWEFHRNRFDACSTRNAYPIMRAATATTKLSPSPTGAPPKPRQSPTDEKPGSQAGPLRPLRE